MIERLNMNREPRTHRRRFYVRQMYNTLFKEMTKFRRATPEASVDMQKLEAFRLIIGLNYRDDIAMLPIGMTPTTPPRVAISISDPQRPHLPQLIVGV